jgi:hypothetical protein
VPLSDADIIQAASGSFTTQNGTVTLPAGTTAGNTVIIVAATHASHGGTVTTPSGFVSDSPAGVTGNTRPYVFRRSNVPADETSWAVSTSSATGPMVRWTCYEVQGLDATAPVDVVLASTTSTATGTTASTGTLAQSTTYDGWVLAAHAAYDSASPTAPTWSGHTGGLAERDEGGVTDGSVSIGLSVSMLSTQQLAAYSSTATCSITLSSASPAGAWILVYSAAGAKREANIAHFWGFKIGAGAAGLATGNAGVRYIETVTGTPAITADGLQLASSAAAENVQGAAIPISGQTVRAAVQRLKLRFDTSLPSVDVELARVFTGSTGPAVLSYRTASGKLGLQIGSGTEQLSAGVVTTGTFYGIDIRLIGTTTAYTADWQVDGIDQAQASFTADAAWSGFTPQLGWSNAITVPGVTYAYALYSIVAGHYPLGEHLVVLVGPDPAATPTVSGTSSSFRRFTANGTIDGSFNAADIRNAVDDWPPTIGASADGLAVVTAHATDYIETPLATYDASGTGSIRAARPVLCIWAASATAATCKVVGWDGTAATTLFAEADPAADNSTTDPAWICKMWRPTGGWTQAKLDAAAIRFGSNDATPDIGPHAVGMEVAVQVAATGTLFGDLASATSDPASAGVLGVDVTPTSGYDATLHYEEGGTPTDVAAPGGTTTTEVIDAPDAPAVEYLALYPPPEDISDA